MNKINLDDRVKKDNRHGTVVAHSPMDTRKVQVHWDGVAPHGGQLEWHWKKSLRAVRA